MDLRTGKIKNWCNMIEYEVSLDFKIFSSSLQLNCNTNSIFCVFMLALRVKV